MKKIVTLTLVLVLSLALVGCGTPPAASTPPASPEVSTPAESSAPATEAPKAFESATQGEWVVTYAAGSGGDIFTRAVTEAFSAAKITEANMPVVNKPEGGGNVGIQYVANITDADTANNTLLTLGGGDLTSGIKLGTLKEGDIQGIALMTSELPIMSKAKDGKYADFTEAVAAMKAGKQVIIVGPQNDYVTMAQQVREALGVTEKELTYIPFTSGKEGLTNLIGGTGDFALSTPSHAMELIKSGDVIPQCVLNPTHFQAGILKDIPTFKELTSTTDAGIPIRRIIAAAKAMSPEAVAYWQDCLKKASESDSFKAYAENYSLNITFSTGDELKNAL